MEPLPSIVAFRFEETFSLASPEPLVCTVAIDVAILPRSIFPLAEVLSLTVATVPSATVIFPDTDVMASIDPALSFCTKMFPEPAERRRTIGVCISLLQKILPLVFNSRLLTSGPDTLMRILSSAS